MLDEAPLNALVIFAWHRCHATLQQACGRERAWKAAGVEGSDHARQCIDRFRIKRMLDAGQALYFKRLHRLDNLVSKLDPADALVAPLDAGRLSLNLNLEPYSADASGLHRESARLAGDTCVRGIAADHGIQRAMATHFLIDYDVYQNVAFQLNACRLQKLDRQNVAGDSAFHIA